MDTLSYLLGKKAGGGSPTPVNLQEKDVSITDNGETVIEPDENYDGLSKVNLTTNVKLKYAPKNIGTIVSGGATVERVNEYLDQIDFTQLNDYKSFFESLSITGNNRTLDLSRIRNSQNIVSASLAFCITGIDKLILPGPITLRVNTSSFGDFNGYGMFMNCSAKEIVGLQGWTLAHNSNPQAKSPFGASFIQAFYNCSKLRKIDLQKITITKPTKQGLERMFDGCSKAELINISGIKLSNLTSGVPAGFINNVPTNCYFVISTASADMTWFTTNYSSYTFVLTSTQWKSYYRVHYNLGDGQLDNTNNDKPYYGLATPESTYTLYGFDDVVPPTGKVFVKWVDKDGNDVSSTITAGTANTELEVYAVYEDNI